MVNSEWVLGVHLQHFENLYNAEIRDGKDFYRCDISYYVIACVEKLMDLDFTECTSECEPYFEIHFKVCFADGTCSEMNNDIACMNNNLATCISPLLVQLHSNESIYKWRCYLRKQKENEYIYIYIYITFSYIHIIHIFIMDEWESGADENGHVRLIDNFTMTIPGKVFNCFDQSN